MLGGVLGQGLQPCPSLLEGWTEILAPALQALSTQSLLTYHQTVEREEEKENPHVETADKALRASLVKSPDWYDDPGLHRQLQCMLRPSLHEKRSK